MRKSFLFAIVVVFLLLVSSTYAIGITPSRVVETFEPGIEKAYGFSVINRADASLPVELYVTGELAEYITLSETRAVIPAGGVSSFTYTVRFPSTLEPGRHEARIGAIEATADDEGFGASMGARAGVEQQFWIDAPFPGQFLSLSVAINDVAVNEPVPYQLTLRSMGTEDLTASGTLEILDSNEEVVTSFPFPATLVKAKTSEILTGLWKGTNKPGEYSARATATFAEKETVGVTNFRVGGVLVRITNINAAPIPVDSVGKIEVSIESFWNDVISDVFASAEIRRLDGRSLGEAKSSNVELQAWGKKTIIIFWDTTDIAVGEYEAEINVKYADRLAVETVRVQVVPKGTGGAASSTGSSNTLLFIIGGVVIVLVLALLIVLWLFFQKKKTAEVLQRESEKEWNDQRSY